MPSPTALRTGARRARSMGSATTITMRRGLCDVQVTPAPLGPLPRLQASPIPLASPCPCAHLCNLVCVRGGSRRSDRWTRDPVPLTTPCGMGRDTREGWLRQTRSHIPDARPRQYDQ